MALTKQAKILSQSQQKTVLAYLSTTRQARRNAVMFLLTVDAGLRAKEVAELTWSMITNGEGKICDRISLENSVSKGKSGGVIFMSKRLRKAIIEYSVIESMTETVIKSQKGGSMSAQSVTNWYHQLYQRLGFDGCSGHSGRRTAITTWARKIHGVGGSMRDVQTLARHSSLQMTMRYIQISEDACRKVVD